MPKYIEKRRRRWYAVLDVPKDLRDTFRTKRLVQSLGTESKTEAERLVLPVVARWKAEFEAERTGSAVPLEELAKHYREDIRKAREEEQSRSGFSDREVTTNSEIYEELLEDKVRKISESDPVQAERVYLIAKDETVDLLEHLETWLADLDNAPKTIDMKRHDVLAFAESYRFSHEVRKQVVQRWAHEYQASNSLAHGTMSRMVSACKGYWTYLQLAGLLDREDNPFENVLSKQKSKSKSKTNRNKGREPFTPAQVVELLGRAKMNGDQQLYDAIDIARWTGCRIEEICSLKVSQVHRDHIEIVDAKSDAGDRKIPIHNRLQPLLDQLCSASEDGYVISNLSTNKYGDRSNALGKRFGRMKAAMGHGKSHVFHSIRKTVATLLENASVNENVSADIMGHEKQTMTYGVYSGGSSLELKNEAIQKLDYPD
ncbi:tyrosine-type recombinase/integrase [Ruegeria arenilitoris]|uniref:tyrosine-type recombinase/integrase n=1 Tax=Ruegeria arenilitoris TaxID=1173585 RepID=UPI00147D5E70|nr:tyrosine-type recombinase/integrase [Ruegeria arenilitoris]